MVFLGYEKFICSFRTGNVYGLNVRVSTVGSGYSPT